MQIVYEGYRPAPNRDKPDYGIFLCNQDDVLTLYFDFAPMPRQFEVNLTCHEIYRQDLCVSVFPTLDMNGRNLLKIRWPCSPYFHQIYII